VGLVVGLVVGWFLVLGWFWVDCVVGCEFVMAGCEFL
jgi:hypothetical protein